MKKEGGCNECVMSLGGTKQQISQLSVVAWLSKVFVDNVFGLIVPIRNEFGRN